LGERGLRLMIWKPATRRAILQGAAALAAAHPLAAKSEPAASNGRLQARSAEAPRTPPPSPGLHKLGLSDARDGLVYVPERPDPTCPMPLVLMLHGAGGTADHVIPMLQGAADQRGILLLAPDSRARDTWDVIRGNYGPDVRFIDRTLGYVFERFPIDPRHVAIGGFSDGASYALSVGLTNGELFRHILAFSPGFAAPTQTTGKPRIFISHGDKDEVLPVERCGRRLARELSRSGYDVDYREFAGGHVVPPDLVDAATNRFLA
jgi:phospholipase/carboxylesterase